MDLRRILETEPALAEAARRLRTEPEAPFPVLLAKFKLTWACNLRCSFCTVWRRPLGTVPTLPAQVVEQALSELSGQGLRKVHLSGGEVLLHPKFQQIVHFARSLGLQVNLTTNGTLVDREQARFLVAQRVQAVTVSVDAPTARLHDKLRGVKGAWKAAWRGIGELVRRKREKGHGPVVAVNTVILRKNVSHLAELHDLLVERGVERWNLLPVDSDDPHVRPTAAQWEALARSAADWRDILVHLPAVLRRPGLGRMAARGEYAAGFYEEHRCFAPWFSLHVEADGRAYACCMGKSEMRPYGNILRATVSDLLASPARREAMYSLASGHAYSVCARCDDFLEENLAFAECLSGQDNRPQPAEPPATSSSSPDLLS